MLLPFITPEFLQFLSQMIFAKTNIKTRYIIPKLF